MAAPNSVVLTITEPETTSTHPVILFDGVCNLCNGFVNFVIDRDPSAIYKFAPLQSRKGIELLRRFGIPTDVSTIILVEGDTYYSKSTGIACSIVATSRVCD
jgi:predicted DCC family thiol-disulfide oxidoreductase YuxK